MSVDAELVTRKLVLIGGDLDRLRSIHARGLDSYLSSRMEQAVVERLLERIVTRMIDVNYHVITAAGQPPPSDYHASFQQLSGLGLLEVGFAARICAFRRIAEPVGARLRRHRSAAAVRRAAGRTRRWAGLCGGRARMGGADDASLRKSRARSTTRSSSRLRRRERWYTPRPQGRSGCGHDNPRRQDSEIHRRHAV